MLGIADQTVDLIWAGRLEGGFRAIAGIGVAQSFITFSSTARSGLDRGAMAMIARAIGAGNQALANLAAQQSFFLSTVYSLLMVIVGLFFTDFLLAGLGASEAVREQTSLYMKIQFVGMMTTAFRMMSGSALQASGDVITPLKATTVSRVAHVALTPFLMFGWGIFPEMGLAGAALSNVIAQVLGAIMNFYPLFRGTTSLRLTLKGFKLDRKILWRLIKVSAPASVQQTERSFAQLLLVKFVSPFGDVALAAYSLTRRIEQFANFGSNGVGQASGVMVGQNLGANRPDRAKQAIGWGLVYVNAMKCLYGIPMLIFPLAVIRVFTNEPGVLELAALWVQLQIIQAFLLGSSQVFQQSYNTAGDTLAPMIGTMIAFWVVELPMAWILLNATDIGPVGLGFAAIAGTATRLIFYVPYFFVGRWLRVRVI